MTDQQLPPSDPFRGFDEARRIMWCHEARACVDRRISVTEFYDNNFISAVHVDNTARADRVYLSAFDNSGRHVGSDILYNDDPSDHLDVTPEFDHDFTALEVPAGSDLAGIIAEERGWVINMRALRTYDLNDDRRETQRVVFLAHLGDMLASGQASGFLTSPIVVEDDESGDESTDAA